MNEVIFYCSYHKNCVSDGEDHDGCDKFHRQVSIIDALNVVLSKIEELKKE
jgi:hypothetical protein